MAPESILRRINLVGDAHAGEIKKHTQTIIGMVE